MEGLKCLPESNPYKYKSKENINVNSNFIPGKITDNSLHDFYDNDSKIVESKHKENQAKQPESNSCYEIRKLELEKKLAALGVLVFEDSMQNNINIKSQNCENIENLKNLKNLKNMKPEMIIDHEKEKEKRIKLREIEKKKRSQGLVNMQYGKVDMSEATNPIFQSNYQNENNNQNIEKVSELNLDQFPQKFSFNNDNNSKCQKIIIN